LRINVFFTPAEILQPPDQTTNDIYIVIDVIRATTTMNVMLDRGATKIFAAQDPEQARTAKELFPDRLLCGERNALPMPGFDYGNSPSQFFKMDLSGREMILSTSNGTRALHACPEGATRLAGSFYNAHAVTHLAYQLASERGSNIAIVCSGKSGYFALDDTACAGHLLFELLHQDRELELAESAMAAIMLYKQNPPAETVEQWEASSEVIEVGLAEDLKYCISMSVSNIVPIVTSEEAQTGLLILEAYQKAHAVR
jgi:2-phosphosulfolactate phosphatase